MKWFYLFAGALYLSWGLIRILTGPTLAHRLIGLFLLVGAWYWHQLFLRELGRASSQANEGEPNG